METLLSYGIRIAPGITALLLMLLILPRRATGLRIVIYIGLFIVMRDAMTPTSLWYFGTEGFFWLRFIDSMPLLLTFAVTSTAIVIAMLIAEPTLRRRIEWLRPSPTGRGGYSESAGALAGAIPGSAMSIGAGLAGAIVTAAPLLLIYNAIPIEARGGEVALTLLPAIAVTSLLGNLYEELLFRGFLQDYLQEELGLTPLHAAIGSGVAFAAGHSFLAVTVTGMGAPLLLFALYEGMIAGLIRMRWGLTPAVLSHGGAIFLLAGGLV